MTVTLPIRYQPQHARIPISNVTVRVSEATNTPSLESDAELFWKGEAGKTAAPGGIVRTVPSLSVHHSYPKWEPIMTPLA